MELPGKRKIRMLPESRDDLLESLDTWKCGTEPIIMASVVDGVLVEHKPYAFEEKLVSDKHFDDKIYSHRWTEGLEANLKGINILSGGKVLEVGCYEGKGTNLMYQHFSPSAYYCIDPWNSDYEDMNFYFKDQYEHFKHNTKHLPIIEMRGKSDDMFKVIAENVDTKFNFIYIDGDHHYEQVLRDLDNATKFLAVGGICLVDDYIWGTDNPVRRACNEFYAKTDCIKRITLANDVQFAFTKTKDYIIIDNNKIQGIY